MEQFHKAPLVHKIIIIALSLAVIAGIVTSVVVRAPERVTGVLADTTPGQVPYNSQPTQPIAPNQTSPPPAQPSPPPPPPSQPSQPPTQPSPPSAPPPAPTQPPSQGPGGGGGASGGQTGQPSAPTSQPPAPPSGQAPPTPPPPRPPTGGTGDHNPPGPPAPVNGSSGQPSGSGSNNPPNMNNGQPAPMPPAQPPVLVVGDPASCIAAALGSAAGDQYRAGTFNPTSDQVSRVSNAGCFSAQVSAGPPPSGPSGQHDMNMPTPSNPVPMQGGAVQPVLTSIAVAPPPEFQPDSPTVACTKSVIGADNFSRGIAPTPDQLSRIQSSCFGQVGPAGQVGFTTPTGQIGLAIAGPMNQNGPTPNGPPSAPPLPPEVQSCVLKAGMTQADITNIEHGQSPTAAQQQEGEGCFQQYAHDKGLIAPTLTPPDPSQPFDPHSKQNECADVVAETHGIHFNQINPSIVSAWSADDIGRLRSCYGVAAASSASAGSMIFAPDSPQVAVSSTKLNCIKQAIGADKLAAVVAGTANISESDRANVYSKCIDPTKTGAGGNQALLGVLAAMPPSDLEGQFIPVNANEVASPTAANSTSGNSTNVAISGTVSVPDGKALPTKVDVFVKSVPKLFTVALTKTGADRATWTVTLPRSKLALGNHKAYAVTTLADATQVRSPDATFAIVATKIASSLPPLIVGIVILLAAAAGAGLAWFLHMRHGQIELAAK